MRYRCLLAALLLGLVYPAVAEDAGGSGFSTFAYNRALKAKENNPQVKKLEKLIVPRAEMENTSIRDLMVFLRAKAKDVDPKGKGFNLFIKASPANLDATVSLDLRNISVLNILQLVEQTTQVQFEFEPYAVVMVDKPAESK